MNVFTAFLVVVFAGPNVQHIPVQAATATEANEICTSMRDQYRELHKRADRSESGWYHFRSVDCLYVK